MRVNVNIPTDFTVGVLTHFMWIPTPPTNPYVAPVPMPSIEIPALQLWTAGFACGTEKWTNGGKKVLHKGLFIMLDGHNTGMLIPDLTVPPAPNMQYPLMWPFSARKVMFSASTVKMGGTAVACSQWIGLPPIPQMTCGDPISAPVDFSMITVTNTVSVGMTLGDLLIGVAACVISMAIDYILSKVMKPPGAQGNLAKGLIEGFLAKMIPGMDKGETIKRVAGAFGDFAVSAMKGDPSFKLVILGNPDGGPIGLEVEIKPPAEGSNDSWITGRGNILGMQGATQGPTNNWGTTE